MERKIDWAEARKVMQAKGECSILGSTVYFNKRDNRYCWKSNHVILTFKEDYFTEPWLVVKEPPEIDHHTKYTFEERIDKAMESFKLISDFLDGVAHPNSRVCTSSQEYRSVYNPVSSRVNSILANEGHLKKLRSPEEVSSVEGRLAEAVDLLRRYDQVKYLKELQSVAVDISAFLAREAKIKEAE